MDQDGHAVEGAETWVAYTSGKGSNRSAKVSGLTDSNGVFKASSRARSLVLGLYASKVGYYTTWLQYDLPYDYDSKKWNPTQTLVLKKIINPIPMFAKAIHANPPVSDTPVGYDLMIGDWVAPHGKGATADMLFTRTYNKKSAYDYDSKITVSFPQPKDGIQIVDVPFKIDEGSGLRSPHEAPVDGYQAQVVRENNQHPGQTAKFEFDERRVYFFRVRTIVDEKNNIKSALYGKIYGDFMDFRYFLNPEPNSRNVEFDPKKNLLKNIKSYERVIVP